MQLFSEYILNEALSKDITKFVKSSNNGKTVIKKTFYKFKTPKTNIQIAYMFESSSEGTIVKFGKIDATDTLTQLVKFITEDFRFINQMRSMCVEDFLKTNSDIKTFIM